MKAYIVFGQTGEYSDRNEWMVKGFFDKSKADAYEDACMKWSHKHKQMFRDLPEEAQEALKKTSPDPLFRCDYTGTDYYVAEVDID